MKYFMMAIMTLIFLSGCHVMQEDALKQGDQGNDVVRLDAPSIIYLPEDNMMHLRFPQGINPYSGDILLDDGTNIMSAYHNGDIATNKGFTGSYKNEGSEGIMTITGDASKGLNFYSFQRVLVKNFTSPAGSVYQDTAQIIQTTSFTNSLKASYDPDQKRVIVSMPFKITDSTSMKMYLYYGTNISAKSQVNPVVSPGRDSIYVDVELNEYPKIILQSIIMENNNEIVYKELELERLPDVIVSEMSINGYLNILLYEVSPDCKYQEKVFNTKSVIWTMDNLKAKDYIQDIGGLTVISPDKRNLFQKWANWEVFLGVKNVRKIEILDGAASMALVYSANVSYQGDVASFRWDIANRGMAMSEPGLKLENVVIRLYGGIGTNYYQTNYSSIADMASNQNVFLDFQGIELPRVEVDNLSVSGYSIVNYLFDGILTYPDISQTGAGQLVKTVYSDRIKVWDHMILYGNSIQSKNNITRIVQNDVGLVHDLYPILDHQYYLYDREQSETGYSYVEEIQHQYTNIQVIDSERGIVSIEKRTTVEFLNDGCYKRKYQYNNSLYSDYYSGISKNIVQRDDFTVNMVYNCLAYNNYDESTDPNWPRYRGAPVDQYVPILSDGYLDSGKVFLKISNPILTIGDSFKQNRYGIYWYYNRWITYNGNIYNYPRRCNLENINRYLYTGTWDAIDHHNLYQEYFRYEGSSLKKYQETLLAQF